MLGLVLPLVLPLVLGMQLVVVPKGVVAQMVEIPAGTFLMGTSDNRFPADREGPVREIATETYLIASHLVTNDEFRRLCESHRVDHAGRV